jgi:uncharacterized sporulation protein YeaH/YhbH (DUF444 family)
MDTKRIKYYNQIKEKGLSPEKEETILSELNDNRVHSTFETSVNEKKNASYYSQKNIYTYNDPLMLQAMSAPHAPYAIRLRSLDELLERDKQREKDGLPRKIRVGRLIKPLKGGKEKIVIVPTTVEDKFLHDITRDLSDECPVSGGSGDGEEGDIIGEQAVHEKEGSGEGPGEGESGPHEMEASAYDLGKILSEHFELPNIKDKGKKQFLSRYTYDMTDRNRGVGQFLDKKATLRKIVETNISLGNIPDIANIDPAKFLISPSDKIYRILSREKEYESQAMVFFLRDYSGSMAGKATQIVVAQHVLIYSWLLYQYQKHVESRFILHDTEATEVPDFYTYYNSKVAGGTKVSSAFHMVNQIVEKENIATNYNVYIFYGTDGDDWDTSGKDAIDEIKKILAYVSRAGITIVRHTYGSGKDSEVEKYIKDSGLLTKHPALLRLDVLQEDADESRLVKGIKKLIS